MMMMMITKTKKRTRTGTTTRPSSESPTNSRVAITCVFATTCAKRSRGRPLCCRRQPSPYTFHKTIGRYLDRTAHNPGFVRQVNLLVDVSEVRDNGRDNNFAESRVLAQGVGLQTSDGTTQNAT